MRKQLTRNQVAVSLTTFRLALIGMEACSSVHYWARKLQALGPNVRLMAPQFVKPYVISNKTDTAGFEAICEAGYFDTAHHEQLIKDIKGAIF